MSDVTRLLDRAEQGDLQAAAELLPLVYDELRKLAAARLAHEKPEQTLQATALVHEAYLRLVGKPGDREQGTGDRGEGLIHVSCSLSPVSFHSRGHFFAAAAEAMRRILIDQARRKVAEKRGGSRQRIELTDVAATEPGSDLDVLELDAALSRLEVESPQKAQLVKLRFFAGLTIDEAAQSLGISAATAKRHWTYARAWLFGQVFREDE